MMNNTIFSAIVTAMINLDDVQGAQILSIVNGMSNIATAPAPAPAVSKTTPATTKKQSNDSKFPELGKPAKIIGFCTLYEGGLVRYWETGFTPDKVKDGIKKSLQEAGAKWNAEKGAYQFTTNKSAGEWVKAQEKRAAGK